MAQNAGLDFNQITNMVMGNKDLLGKLQDLGKTDTAEAKNAVRAAGIPISGEQVQQLMALLSKIDISKAMSGVDLSDGFDMKDIQGALGALMGGGNKAQGK